MKLLIYKFKKAKVVITSFMCLALGISGCKKLIDVNPPVTSINSANVYNSDATAAAVLTGMYSNMSNSGSQNNFVTGSNSVSLLAGLSSDEFTLWSGGNSSQIAYYKNSLSVTVAGFEYWNKIYPYVFSCNSAIEGLKTSTSLTPTVKQQLLGEAKFIRAFCYFYLVNLYGDVPLVLTSDYTVNASLSRTPKSLIYQQIIIDLKDAQGLLSANYLDATLLNATAAKVRPTKWAADALLARVYLYTSDYINAEVQATNIISNSTLYNLSPLNSTFLANSSEAIWQLQPVLSNPTNTTDAVLFITTSGGPSAAQPVNLSPSLLNSFETGDLRKVNGNWINSIVVAGTTYYYPYKYKVNNRTAPVSEYLMILRLGEQYLIRAEARAQQGNFLGAQSDLNIIRTRAGLTNTTASTQPTLLTAIQHERQVELFSEWGDRWMDLKRTGNVDAVMGVQTPVKGGIWNSYQQLYPLPLGDLQKDGNLVQNTGY